MSNPPRPIPARSTRTTEVRGRISRALFICVLFLAAAGLRFGEQQVSQNATEAWNRIGRLLAGRPLPGDLEKVPQMLPSTLRRMLVDGRIETAFTALRSQPAGVRARAALFEVAANLEAGELHRARTLWQGVSFADPPTPFQKRIARGMDAMQSGVRGVLFDRNGVPVAYRSASGKTSLSEAIDPRLVPQQSLAVLPELGGARLTLDLDLSRRLLDSFRRRTSRRVQGGLVVLDARDAGLLATVTTNKPKGNQAHDFLLSLREPASIAKLITTSATLRAGWNPSNEIRRNRCDGGVLLGGTPLYCSSIDGRLSGLDEALATSCNVAFALLGKRLGAGSLVAEYRRYGFAQFSQRTQPLYGHLLQSNPNQRELGDLSIGLNVVEITPLHAAVLARTLVDGYLRTPHLLTARDGLLGLSPRAEEIDQTNRDLLGRLPAPVEYLDLSEPLLAPEWIPTLHSAMIAVADPGGTANGVEPRGFGVAMKTGTGSNISTGFHINYIGFAPTDNPRFAFALRLTHGRTSKRIGRQARAITKEILEVLSTYQTQPVVPSAETQVLHHPTNRASAFPEQSTLAP